jgi:hypothetical protein
LTIIQFFLPISQTIGIPVKLRDKKYNNFLKRSIVRLTERRSAMPKFLSLACLPPDGVKYSGILLDSL